MENLYKVNYSLVALGLWLISIILFVLSVFQPDAGTRFYSFLPLFGVILFIGLLTSITHLILRKKTAYKFKGKALAIIMLVLIIITFLFPLYSMARTDYGVGLDCHKEHRYGYGCEQDKDNFCSHYSGMGFGRCDVCETIVCPNK